MSMAAEIKPVENPGDYDPWFEAVSSGDWCKAKVFLTQHPSAITATDSFGDTALHNAVFAWHEQIVEELVQLMTEEQLETKNKWGLTALAIAAGEENIKMVECLVAKNKKLLGIADHNQMTPILIAAENHRWDIVRYLYSQTPLEDLKPDKGPCGSQLVIYCLQAKQFDIVLKLLDYCPALGYAKGFESYPIYEFALLPSAFPSGTSLKFWQRWIYKYIHVEHAPSVSDARINVQNQENEQGDQRNSTDLGLLQGLPSWLSEFFGINHICELKLHHVRSREILDIACDLIKDLKKEEMTEEMTANRGLRDTLLLAAQNGIVELVTTVCKARPELLKGMYGKPIFHRAVEHRQENVYSLIYGISKTDDLATLKDNSGNSMLHYAGMLSPLEKLNGVAGPALQMQRERQWYKEVESFVVTATGASPFEEHILTAARLFTQNHEELHKKGEKWMKATSSSYTVVNALIVTIMFAAAFTVPGGNNPETGYPIFLNKKLFMVFIVSDAISLFSSATSALMFLGIHISRYAEDDFLTFLPTKMITGIFTLFISILAMMVAFSSALFIMLQHKSLIITPIIAFASVPVIYFIWMHFPLLFEILLSTYGGGLFNKKCKRWINV
ncbi:uncharacterized protein LOC126610486 isoform X3 [Malus sylvestris]|uniref:uncharacterized protein LOC126610486 isoform X3 n=1 Tax=Malus sylvestris TaxID=3752 RepID=UPI0021ACB6C3|nr:uncharacterized protein LOC126610486 isoform X3 [Malus sylvestris]